MEDLEKTDALLRLHLGSTITSCAWKLLQSPVGGRGVFAARDLVLGDVVFVDPPLVLGPRGGTHTPQMCVGCYSSESMLVPCSKGCGLPVCGQECETRGSHTVECSYLITWRKGRSEAEWCPRLFRTVTAIRCLGLDNDQRRLVRHLQTHSGRNHEQEVELLKQNIDAQPSTEDEEFMRISCQAMDANAFEVEVSTQSPAYKAPNKIPPSPDVLTKDSLPPICGEQPVAHSNISQHSPAARPAHKGSSSKTSLRGLYPLSAMMNHECSPNTRHGYDAKYRMIVRATRAIPQGTEITTSYCTLLWGTLVRRHHLATTKHFLCSCQRCRDPQEGRSRLAALRCATRECPGSMLPLEPLQSGARWQCDACGLLMPDKQARIIQASLGQYLLSVVNDKPESVVAFLQEPHGVTSSSNQLIVDMKTTLVWAFGHRAGYQYPVLTEEYLLMKIMLCRELLLLLETLGAGQCRMRGLLLYELWETLVEKQRRAIQISQNEVEEIVTTLDEVHEMFVDDVTSPVKNNKNN